jgi:hypothetical protein
VKRTRLDAIAALYCVVGHDRMRPGKREISTYPFTHMARGIAAGRAGEEEEEAQVVRAQSVALISRQGGMHIP